MKKLCCIILVLLTLVGCSAPKPILVNNADYNAIINIVYKEKSYQYSIHKNCNETIFKSCGKTLPIDFIVSKNNVSATYNNNTEDYSDSLDNSVVSIINNVLLKSEDKEVYADYNGNYILHDVISAGEFALKLDKNGFPVEISIVSKDLLIKFSDVKEVSKDSEKQ